MPDKNRNMVERRKDKVEVQVKGNDELLHSSLEMPRSNMVPNLQGAVVLRWQALSHIFRDAVDLGHVYAIS